MGIVAQQCGNVLLVDIGGRERRQAQGESGAGHGAHAAQYTQVTTLGKAIHFKTPKRCCAGLGKRPGLWHAAMFREPAGQGHRCPHLTAR